MLVAVRCATLRLKEGPLLQQNESWPEISEDLKRLSLSEVAVKYNVSPADLALAVMGTGLPRQPVRKDPPPSSEPSKETSAKRSKAASGSKRSDARSSKESSSSKKADASAPTKDKVVINGITCRPGTRDVAIAEHIDKLGKISDPEFGQLVGASPRVVGAFRRKHGIEAFRAASSTTTKNPAASRKGGKPSKIDAHYDLLGTVPDSQVAELAGVTVNAVSNYRRRRNIPAYDPSEAPSGAAKPTKTGRKPSKIEPFHDDLGTVPDRVIAEKAGVTLNAVSNYRRRRGISAFDPSTSPESSEPVQAERTSRKASSPAPAVVSGSKVYAVRLSNGTDSYVVADSLVHAAQQVASRSDVVGLTLLGGLLT